MTKAYQDGVLAAANLIAEDAQFYNELADKLLDLTDGRMSLHPADRMKARKYRDKAELLSTMHHKIKALLHDTGSDSGS